MDTDADILVAGPGAAGLSTAIGLAQSGYRVVLAGPVETRHSTRTVALFEGSLRFLASLGMRETIEAAGQPLEVMRIADDTGSPFRRPPVEFRASEIGSEYFGFNVENSRLVALLLEKAGTVANLTLNQALVERYEFGDSSVTATLAGGGSVSARLLAASDGARSPARRAAGIKVQTWSYGQTALTAFLSHAFDHANVSSEYHTRQGPCTFVPLSPQGIANGAGVRHASSLVWLMTPKEAERRLALDPIDLEEEIADAAHGVLGPVKLLRPVNTYPIRGLAARRLTAHRIALVGEAAHVLPPIGAQGLNLGFRDAAHLCEVLEPSAGQQIADPGADAVLQDYASKRQMDVASRTFGIDLLNRALLNHSVPMDMLRGFGISAVAGIGPLRRRIMQEGMSPQTGAPLVMRERRRAATANPSAASADSVFD